MNRLGFEINEFKEIYEKYLFDKKFRNRDVNQLISDFYSSIENDWPGTDIEISTIKEGPPVSDNLVIDIKGQNIQEMENLSLINI